MRPKFLPWLILALTLIAVIIDLPKIPSVKLLGKSYTLNFPLKLGLDLKGGTQLVYQLDTDKIPLDKRDEIIESIRKVIERRVNPQGISEALVQKSKVGDKYRVIIELPGENDASSAARQIGRTAQLEFREIPVDLSDQEKEATKTGIPIVYLAHPTGLTGADLEPNSASVVFGSSKARSSAEVSLRFNEQGTKKFGDITQRNVGKQLAIFLDQELLSAPVVQSPILDGRPVISGNFTTQSAKQLADLINGGALQAPVNLVEQRTIGATLGQESVNKSLIAGIIGLGVIALYMGIYYGFLGLVADGALIIYTLFVLVIFKTGLFILPPVTLTLAGIAGFILSIGMAVDANILIFERMKEEARWGKSKTMAMEQGFKRAWSSIWASNVSSLITAVILYSMGQSVVRGFAVTLAIGVLVSMFTAVVVTRTFLKLIT